MVIAVWSVIYLHVTCVWFIELSADEQDLSVVLMGLHVEEFLFLLVTSNPLNLCYFQSE